MFYITHPKIQNPKNIDSTYVFRKQKKTMFYMFYTSPKA